MKYPTYSGDYEILDSNTVYLYDLKSNFEIIVSPNKNFTFTIVLKFIDDAKEQALKKSVKDNIVTFECMKFEDTGTILPQELGTAEGKKMFIHFWGFKPADSIRKVEYTIFKER